MSGTGKKKRKRFTLLRRALIACAVLLALAALGLFVVLPEIVRRGHLNAAVEKALSEVLGADVRVGSIEMTPASHVVVREIRAFIPGESTPFLTAQSIVIGGDVASIMSGRYSSIEASGVKFRLSLKDGKLNWVPPETKKKISIPRFAVRDADIDLNLEGVPLRLRGVEMALTDFGGDLRTAFEGRMRLGGSSSEIALSGGFYIDRLPESLSLTVAADDISLADLAEIVAASGLHGLELRGGRGGLRLKLEEGRAVAEIAVRDFAASSLAANGEAADTLHGDAILAVEYDMRKNTLTVSAGSDNYVELDGLCRLDFVPGSFFSFGGASPVMDLRLTASRIDLARATALLGPENPLRKKTRVSGSLLAREIHVFGPVSGIEADIDAELADAAFDGCGAAVQGLSGLLKITGPLSGPLTAQVNLNAKHAAYDYDGNVAAEDDVGLSGALRLNPSKFTLEADATLTLAGADRFTCGGSVNLSDGSLERVRLESAGEVDSQRVWSVVQRLFLPDMADWRLNGRAEGRAAAASYTGEDGVMRYVVAWRADLRGCEARAPFLEKPLTGLTGRAGAEVVIGAEMEEVRNISAELSGPQFERIAVSRGFYKTASGGGPARFDAECAVKSRANRDALEALLGAAPGGEFLSELLDWDTQVEVAAAGTESEFTVSLNSLKMTNAPLREKGEPPRRFEMKDIMGRVSRAGESLRLTASIPALDADDMWNRARHMFPESMRDARFKGVFRVDCAADFKKDGAWSADVALTAESDRPARAFRYSTPNGEDKFYFGNVTVSARVQSRPGSDLLVDAKIDAKGFQFIHVGQSAFYFDIIDQPVDIRALFQLKDGGAALLFDDATLKIETIGEMSLNGLLDGKAMDLAVKINGLDAERLFKIVLAENFSGKFDFLEEMRVGGKITSDGLRLRGPIGGPHLTGRIGLREIGVAYKDFVVEGLDADVPVDLAFSADQAAEGGEQEGVITFRRFGVGPAQVATRRLPFRLVNRDMIFDTDLLFEVPGGTLHADGFRINGVTVSQVAGHETEFLISGLGGDIDLERFTGEMGWTKMDGALDVRLGEVSMRGEKMTASGGMTMRAFGGEVEFEGLSADSVFRGPAAILFSANIKDVSLRQVSNAFGFGEISGTLRGKITEFEYVMNNANRFEINLEVVDGERRYIRPEFIRDFVYVNSGRIADVPRNVIAGIGTMMRYPYRSFGIHAKLRNNYFKLDSPYEYDGLQAFMLAKWYGGVNIINDNPGRVYMWKPVYERISNVLAGKLTPETSVNVGSLP